MDRYVYTREDDVTRPQLLWLTPIVFATRQLGHNDRVNRLKPTFVQALDGEFVSEITCGWSHSVALTSKGKLPVWSTNVVIGPQMFSSPCCKNILRTSVHLGEL